MNWPALLSLLATLASNKYVKSALISLAGVIGAALTQSATGADLGSTGAAIAAGVSAWVANLLKELSPLFVAWLQARLTGGAPQVDLTTLNGLGPLSEDQIADLQAQGIDAPPPAPRLMRDETRLSLLWLVPWLWLCCQSAQAAPPKAVLVGPTSARPGVPIRFDASQSVGDIEHYILKVRPQSDQSPSIQYDIKSKEEGRPPVFDKTRPYIWGVPGTWEIELLVVSPDGQDDATSITVTVPGSTPCPNPQPVTPTPVDPAPPRPPAPNPTPNPVTPTPPVQPDPTPSPTPPAPSPGRFGLRDRVRTAVLGVTSPTRAAEVAKLRTRLTELKADATAGKLTQQQILNGMVDELKSLPGSWQLVKTLASLGIQFLVNGKQLQTVQDWVDLLAEILDALIGL